MPLRIGLAIGLVALLVAAGCGSSSSSSNKTTSNATATPASSSGKTVTLASASVGKILVGPNGRTLYLFEKDKGPTSQCKGDCPNDWPPLTTTGTPSAGTGINAAMLGTGKLADGKTVVTYNNHPLYYFAGDTKAGQMTGQGLDRFGAEWYVVGPNGSKVEGGEKKSSSSSSSDSSGGGSTPSPY
jgi:predicted lipoprotein with Yx(FWY)xxD motif